MNSRKKLVWICHFSNNEIKSLLKPWRDVQEFAPWMPLAIETMEGNEEYELTVVAPYPYICGIKRFELRGVKYVFYNANIPFVGINYPRWFPWDYMTDYFSIKKIVSGIVNKIHPDLIHLFGAENHDYSPAILSLIGKYPIALTVQGFISHTTHEFKYIERKASNTEKEIIKKIPVIFYERKKQRQDIKEINPDARLHWHTYCSYEVSSDCIVNQTPIYDLVFFGRVNKDKGIVDVLESVRDIKERYHKKIKLCVIGRPSTDEFFELAKTFGINDQITWTGFLPTRKDVFLEAQKAKISILPTYHDVMPGTIMESMFMGIPVISYATDSIPEINEDYEAICLVERGNKEALTKAIYSLLDDNERLLKYKDEGKKRAYEMFAPTKDELRNCLTKGYSDAITLFQKK